MRLNKNFAVVQSSEIDTISTVLATACNDPTTRSRPDGNGNIINKKRYQNFMPDKVHCAHILVKTEQEAKAVLDRLKQGEKFANIAKGSSLCPSGKRGGDLGVFSRGKMVKEFENAAFALQKGQVSPIIKTKFGYHVIKRLE